MNEKHSTGYFADDLIERLRKEPKWTHGDWGMLTLAHEAADALAQCQERLAVCEQVLDERLEAKSLETALAQCRTNMKGVSLKIARLEAKLAAVELTAEARERDNIALRTGRPG